MNLRIEKLAKEAGGHNNISKFRGHFLPPPPGYIDPATVDLEKFAELIIKECLMECWYDCTPKEIVQNIKQRFGVEE